ncbi:MAG: copA 2, partial [Gemmataceae bacterium]|nr:copA 2 [Gemmataceae bacterium]
MPHLCANCGGPIAGPGHAGRPWPDRAAAAYCCFGCLSLGEHDRQEARTPGAAWKFDGLGVRLGIGILVVGQSMIFGLALNLHDDVPAAARRVAESLILGATVLVIAILGGPLVRAAWNELRRGRLTIEALFLLTLSGAMAASLQAYLTGRGKIYFEVVSVLLVVYTLGKVIGARSRAVAVAGSRAWAGQLSTCRRVDGDGRARTVPVTEIRPGDVVEVDPGETIAVDGVVRQGTGFVSEAPVSGEPFAVVRRPGDRVLAGTASHDATFRVEATAPGTGRQVDELLAAVEAARARPASFQGQADRIGRAFFPLVVVTALATFGYWSVFTPAGWEVGLFHAMSVLLVACPCVIGLATPVVIWSVIGRLAERGLIVRAGNVIERLAEVNRVLFDKTGTLTDDRFALLDIVTAAEGDERAKVLGWVALVESHSSHPIAKPFAQLPQPFPPGGESRVSEMKAIPGCGVEAAIEEADGRRHRIRIGRPEWVGRNLTPQAPPFSGEGLRATTGHRIDIAVDGELAAVAVAAERLRESVPATLADFRALGLPVEVLTGDTSGRAAALGLPPTRAGLLPADKRARVDELKAAGGNPLVVGDGINDASALAAAHVGVALASGTDLAVGAAAVTLYHGDLRVLPWAIALSREAVRTVRRNLYRALAYNLIGMTLAACGVLHPVVAVLLMMASSLSLIFSSARVGVVPDHCSGSPASGGREPPE